MPSKFIAFYIHITLPQVRVPHLHDPAVGHTCKVWYGTGTALFYTTHMHAVAAGGIRSQRCYASTYMSQSDKYKDIQGARSSHIIRSTSVQITAGTEATWNDL